MKFVKYHLTRLRTWWKQTRCEHYWRPCRRYLNYHSYRPVRWCDYCGKVEELTMERFYAEFGRMPF